jgi:hypothetical protein
MTLNALSSQPVPATGNVASDGLPISHQGVATFYQPVDMHRALNDVQQMPEFQPAKPSWLDELWKQPLIKKFGHQIGQVIHQALRQVMLWLSKLKPTGLSHLPENIRDIFSGFVGFILVLVGLFALYVLLGWLLRLKEKAFAQTTAPTRLLENVLLVSSTHHYGQAQAAAEASDYETALKQLYMATLCMLDERKVAPYEATRTNLEYSALLGQGQGASELGDITLKQSFERMARRFESVCFGLRHISPGQFEQSRSEYQRMQTLAEGWVHE